MSKRVRKAIVGGYEGSSDDSELESVVVEPSIKKVKSTPLTLPGRWSSGSERRFLLPSTGPPPFSRSPSLSSQVDSFRTTSAQAGSLHRVAPVPAPTAAEALESGATQHSILLEGDTLDHERGSPSTLTTSQHLDDAKGRKPVLKVRTVDGPLAQLEKPRSTIAMERQLNEALMKIEECQQTWDQKHQQTQDKLTELLQVVQLLTPTNISPSRGLNSGSVSPVAQMNPDTLAVSGVVSPWRYSHLSNPPPPPGFLVLVTRACDSKIQRTERDTMVENSIKRIKWVKDVGPYFEDENGEPDTLPEYFVDPETKRALPCPYWPKALNKQIDWIPTWLEWCKGTISNDSSEISLALRSLTDEEWVCYLHFGPFRTGQQTWRNSKKTEEELQAMRVYQIMYRKAEYKSFLRTKYIQSIPALRGPQLEFLCHRGYMSDEAEENGVIVVKRPSHRSSLINNLFDAIWASETRKRLKARPGSTFKPRQIQFVDTPVPQLEQNNDKKKVFLIPSWALAKGWKDQNSIQFSKATHLINTGLKSKPDISAFLAQNPMFGNTELSGGSVKIERASQPTDGGDTEDFRSEGNEQSQGEGGEYDGAYGIRAQSHDLFDPPASVAHPLDLSTADTEALVVPHHRNTIGIPIDPQLLDAVDQDHSNVTTTMLQADAAVPSFELPVHPTAPILAKEISDLGANPPVSSAHAGDLHPSSASSMPPPPLLQPVVEADRHPPTYKSEEKRKVPRHSVRATKKADRKSSIGVAAIENSDSNTSSEVVDRTELYAEETHVSDSQAPVKRGRGRPKGSKNKLKATMKG
ncbi:hypothetical protein RSOL_352520, partial [Rhizoctonia solani AG-3 Rhs1AP]